MNEIYFNYRSEKYNFLSNLYPVEITVVNPVSLDKTPRKYGSVEHFYQSAKYTDPELVQWIINSPTPFSAMKAGQSFSAEKIRKDWDRVKDTVMMAGLKAKFVKNEGLKEQLVLTGDAVLHENTSHPYWGFKGQDKLGKMIMQIRDIVKISEW